MTEASLSVEQTQHSVSEYNSIVPIINNWYSNTAIKFEIAKQLYLREFCAMNKSAKYFRRLLKCHNVQQFDWLMNYLRSGSQAGDLFNLYYSLAKYGGGIPNQNYSLPKSERDKNTDEWNKVHHLNMTEYDFLLDIDADEHSQLDYAIQGATLIKNWFDSHNVPYQLRFSGCGFHFIISYEYFNGMNIMQMRFNPTESPNIYQFYSRIAKYLKDEFCDLVDWKIYDSRRVCKLPYSLSVYNVGESNQTAYLCMPFVSDEQFKAFDLRFVDCRNITADNFKCRGLHIFNPIGNTTVLQEIANAQN
jgi:hypothetical protein